MTSQKSTNKDKQLSVLEQHTQSIEKLEKRFNDFEILLRQRSDSIQSLEKKMLEFQEIINADRYSNFYLQLGSQKY
jgi:hypothetical protein